jgi:hypothetical protein
MMRQLHGAEWSTMVARLVKATQEGPVTDWVQRMSEVARELGVELWDINWNQTPKLVAHDIVEYVNSADLVDTMEWALEKLEQK